MGWVFLQMIEADELARLNKEQEELAKNIKICKLNKVPRYIGGIDVAYWNGKDQEFAVSSLVVWDCIEKRVVHKLSALDRVEFPYISGYLSYREAGIESIALKNCKHQIDVLLVDGNGMLHTRKAGIAVKLGVDFGMATIGVAKSYYKVDGFSCEIPGQDKGDYKEITYQKEIVGRIVRTQTSIKPIYVSVGNKITLEEATQIVINTCGDTGNLPIPLKLADKETRIVRDRYIATMREQEREYNADMLCSK